MKHSYSLQQSSNVQCILSRTYNCTKTKSVLDDGDTFKLGNGLVSAVLRGSNRLSAGEKWASLYETLYFKVADRSVSL